MSLTAQERFEVGLRGSHYTKRTYMFEVERYMKDSQLQSMEELLSGSTTQLQDRLIAYLDRLDKQGLVWATRNKILSAITDFYIANSISLDWKYLQRSLGPMGAKHVNVAYTHKQIATIIQAGKTRLKAAVALLATAGVRAGVVALDDPDLFYNGEFPLDVLKVGHIAYDDKSKMFAIKPYVGHGAQHEYMTFMTPQASVFLVDYLQERKKVEGKLSPDAWLFANHKHPEMPMTKAGLYNELTVVLNKTGIRKSNEIKQERHDTPITNGFREWFTTCLVNAGINPAKVEYLQGHHPRLMGSYYRPTLQELLVGTRASPTGYVDAFKAMTLPL